jgi:glycosyltransferase involved in cell wall biosynthesis
VIPSPATARALSRPASKKVLHVINTLRGGGAEMNLIRLAQHTDRSRVEPHLAYCGHWPLETEVERCGVPILRLDENGRRVRSAATPRIIARLAAYILKNDIQLVHTHLFNAHAWAAPAARLVGVKVLEHVHDHRYTDRAMLMNLGLPDTRQYDQAPLLARLSHHIVVLTNHNRDQVMQRLGMVASRISVITNGLAHRGVAPASDERARLRLSLGIPADAFVLLGVGRLANEKNFKTLIAAAERVRAHVPALHVLILGQGPERDDLQARIDAVKLGGVVKLAGHHADVQAYYDCADVFVQPSYFELHSLAMLEAMQAGLPAIVSQGVGANDEMITHARTGFLVHPNDVAQWAQIITTLFEQPALRAAVGCQGRALVESNCDIRHVCARFESLYEELCGI